MKKTNVNLTLDYDIAEEAKRLDINISNKCNEFLAQLINFKKNDVISQGIYLKKSELKIRMEELSNLQLETIKLKEEVSIIEALEKERELENIKNKQQHLDKMQLCLTCLDKIENLETAYKINEGKFLHLGCASIPGNIKRATEKVNKEKLLEEINNNTR